MFDPHEKSPSLLAGIDVGTTNLKVGLHDLSGRCIVASRVSTPRTAEGLVAATLGALAECVSQTGTAPVAVGITGMAETGVPLDRAGSSLAPLIWWHDPRGADEAADIRREVGDDALYAASGRWVGAKNPLAKWTWLRRNAPEVMTRMRLWASTADLVLHGMTGLWRTHPTLAARTLAYDMHARRFDPDMLALAGMTASQLPELSSSSEIAGVVTREVAASTGLRPGTPVVLAGQDHSVGAWAAGMREHGTICDSMGTSEAVTIPATVMPDAHRAIDSGITCDPALIGSGFVLTATLPTSGATVEWLSRTVSGAGTVDGYGELLRLAAACGSGGLPTGLIVEPYLRGRVAPAPDPARRLSIHGIGDSVTPSTLVAAAIEGTCLHVRWMTEVIAALAGASPERLVAFGGQVRIPLWMRIKAAVSTIPVDVVHAEDAVCAGAALMAGRASGLLGDEPVLAHRTDVPDPALQASYQPCYRQFLQHAALPLHATNPFTESTHHSCP